MDKKALEEFVTSFEDIESNPDHSSIPLFAYLTQSNDQLTLNAMINKSEVITEFPALEDLPSFKDRHPIKSALWTASSPFTGTIMHTVGVDHMPGIVAAGSSLLLATEMITVGALLGYVVTLFTDAVTVPQLLATGSTLFLIHGLYRWGTSEY